MSLLRSLSTTLMRDDPFASPGSEVSLQWQVAQFWNDTFSELGFSPRLLDNVWAANRCLQLNSQQIASMPLRFKGTWETPPAWFSNPDPVWFPNGIADALFAVTDSIYRWGDAFLFVTTRYASGFPQTWTVLDADPARLRVTTANGRRAYRIGETQLDPANVVQITRNPRGGLRGTSALSAYATTAWNVIAGGETTNSVLNNLPPAVLKTNRKATQDQAEAIQDRWVSRAALRGRGVPPVLPPEIDLVATNLGFTPKDLLLLESKEYDVRVIATAFGVPASLLNMAVAGGLTYQNPAMLGEQWWRFELLPTAGRLAAALSSQMLPKGNMVEFDASAVFSPLDESSEGQITDPPPMEASPADVRPFRPVEVTA